MVLYGSGATVNAVAAALGVRPGTAKKYLERVKVKYAAVGRPVRTKLQMSREALQKLADYSWPGNVRELENVIERAVVLCRGDTLTIDDLPEVVVQATAPAPERVTISIGTPLDEVESLLIRETLRHTKGDKTLAAQLLGISTRTIYRKLGEDAEG